MEVYSLDLYHLYQVYETPGMLPNLIFRGNHIPPVREALPTLLSRRWRQLGFQEVSTTVPIEVELPLDADVANGLSGPILASSSLCSRSSVRGWWREVLSICCSNRFLRRARSAAISRCVAGSAPTQLMYWALCAS
jgi:hypothetical protein